MNFGELKTPFPAEGIEWRIAERGSGQNGQWAKVLAYITNRAIMDRLDAVCGPGGWKNEFVYIQGAFLCGLSLKIGDEWVTKWDGAQESNIEATKGGISGAMKRAAVQWGIGRYLYDLEVGWANINPAGANYAGKDQKKNLDAMKWDAPDLPVWALPDGAAPKKKKTATGHPASSGGTSDCISEAQGKRLGAICNTAGIKVSVVSEKFGFAKKSEIKKSHYKEICEWAESGHKDEANNDQSLPPEDDEPF